MSHEKLAGDTLYSEIKLEQETKTNGSWTQFDNYIKQKMTNASRNNIEICRLTTFVEITKFDINTEKKIKHCVEEILMIIAQKYSGAIRVSLLQCIFVFFLLHLFIFDFLLLQKANVTNTDSRPKNNNSTTALKDIQTTLKFMEPEYRKYQRKCVVNIELDTKIMISEEKEKFDTCSNSNRSFVVLQNYNVSVTN